MLFAIVLKITKLDDKYNDLNLTTFKEISNDIQISKDMKIETRLIYKFWNTFLLLGFYINIFKIMKINSFRKSLPHIKITDATLCTYFSRQVKSKERGDKSCGAFR
jgi:hypothetical protein